MIQYFHVSFLDFLGNLAYQVFWDAWIVRTLLGHLKMKSGISAENITIPLMYN